MKGAWIPLCTAALLAPLPAAAWFSSNVPAAAPSTAALPEAGGGAVPTPAALGAARLNWVLRSGRSLSEELTASALAAGWKFRWELAHDYPVEADIPLAGTVEEMLTTLVQAYQARGEMAGVSPYVSSINRVAGIGVIDMGVAR